MDPRNDDVASFIAYVRNTLGRQFDDLDVKLEARLNHAPEMAGRMIAPDLKRNVLLVMREALNNALKHSGADRIIVDLNIRPEELALRVQDNGKGFEVGRTREGGNGLQNFQRRAEEVHGTCSTTSGATGTVVEFTAPISSTKMGARPT